MTKAEIAKLDRLVARCMASYGFKTDRRDWSVSVAKSGTARVYYRHILVETHYGQCKAFA